MTAEPFARGDNGIELTKRISQRAQLAYDLIVLLVPRLLEKYKDQLVKFETKVDNTADITLGDDIVLIRLKAQSFGSMEEEKRRLTLLGSRSRTETFEAFEQAAIDLIRLDRYERRAWSRQKHAIRAFMNLKLMRNLAQRHLTCS
jgi:hypothetical protein